MAAAFSVAHFRPYIRANPAASLAGKPRLQIRRANVIRPSIAADRSPMRAMIIRAIDQKIANAGGAHFTESDLLLGLTNYHPD